MTSSYSIQRLKITTNGDEQLYEMVCNGECSMTFSGEDVPELFSEKESKPTKILTVFYCYSSEISPAKPATIYKIKSMDPYKPDSYFLAHKILAAGRLVRFDATKSTLLYKGIFAKPCFNEDGAVADDVEHRIIVCCYDGPTFMLEYETKVVLRNVVIPKK